MAAFLNIRRHKEHVYRPLPDYSDGDSLRLFRFSRDGIRYLCQLCGDDMIGQDARGVPIPLESKIMIALSYLAGNTHQSQIANCFGIHQSSVSRILSSFCQSMSSKSGLFIKLPTARNEIAAVKTNFYQYCRIPSIVGVTDGTHIKISDVSFLKADGSNDERAYVNRKSYYSINCVALIDYHKKLPFVSANSPGSAHDSAIFRRSPVWEFFENCPENNVHYGSIILADSGFPCRRWMMTPYSQASLDTQSKKNFNKALSRGRVRVEHSFGMVKRRFTFLKTGCRIPLEKIPRTILTCCILHNICVDWGFPMPEDEPDDDEWNNPDQQDEEEGLDVQNRLPITDRQARIIGQRVRDQLAEALIDHELEF